MQYAERVERLTETQKILGGHSRAITSEKDIGGGEVCGQAEQTTVEELHSGLGQTVEVVGEKGGVDEVHPGAGVGYMRREREYGYR